MIEANRRGTASQHGPSNVTSKKSFAAKQVPSRSIATLPTTRWQSNEVAGCVVRRVVDTDAANDSPETLAVVDTAAPKDSAYVLTGDVADAPFLPAVSTVGRADRGTEER